VTFRKAILRGLAAGEGRGDLCPAGRFNRFVGARRLWGHLGEASWVRVRGSGHACPTLSPRCDEDNYVLQRLASVVGSHVASQPSSSPPSPAPTSPAVPPQFFLFPLLKSFALVSALDPSPLPTAFSVRG
jgi:hypothetical protein